jgi:hypothetical protein
MTTDRDGNRSNPYHPDPAHCCEACVFGTGEHAAFCSQSVADSQAIIAALELAMEEWRELVGQHA